MHNYQCLSCLNKEAFAIRLPMHTGKCSKCGDRLLYTGEFVIPVAPPLSMPDEAMEFIRSTGGGVRGGGVIAPKPDIPTKQGRRKPNAK